MGASLGSNGKEKRSNAVNDGEELTRGAGEDDRWQFGERNGGDEAGGGFGQHLGFACGEIDRTWGSFNERWPSKEKKRDAGLNVEEMGRKLEMVRWQRVQRGREENGPSE